MHRFCLEIRSHEKSYTIHIELVPMEELVLAHGLDHVRRLFLLPLFPRRPQLEGPFGLDESRVETGAHLVKQKSERCRFHDLKSSVK